MQPPSFLYVLKVSKAAVQLLLAVTAVPGCHPQQAVVSRQFALSLSEFFFLVRQTLESKKVVRLLQASAGPVYVAQTCGFQAERL